MKTAALLLALAVAVPSLGAQVPTQRPDTSGHRAAPAAAAAAQHAAEPGIYKGVPEDHHGCEEFAPGDFITPHITDAHCLDLPRFPRFWEAHEVALPRWEPVRIGNVAIDFSPTKHVVMLLVAALLCCIVLIGAARAHVRHTKDIGRAKGFAAGIEAMVLYVRSEVGLNNLGPHGEAYAPFIMALFFFILFANLLGLIPFGSTATGNVSVTATLAIITFVVVEIAGMRAQGLRYLDTIFYWNKDLSLPIRIPMFIIMSPIEVVGKIAKPFALTVRLFANMTAGHIVVLALIGLIFTFKSYVLGTAPLLMAVAIMMLEIFVAFLQAYIFALLASVFIGQIRESAH
ncbi:MAG TPA: F0F1 ATP synthase subunit A [Gemmatimonadaceae bacterium]|nr:F0F1 ATP synthase subunit A [Gemmatimonadaceae bacterium]